MKLSAPIHISLVFCAQLISAQSSSAAGTKTLTKQNSSKTQAAATLDSEQSSSTEEIPPPAAVESPKETISPFEGETPSKNEKNPFGSLFSDMFKSSSNGGGSDLFKSSSNGNAFKGLNNGGMNGFGGGMFGNSDPDNFWSAPRNNFGKSKDIDHSSLELDENNEKGKSSSSSSSAPPPQSTSTGNIANSGVQGTGSSKSSAGDDEEPSNALDSTPTTTLPSEATKSKSKTGLFDDLFSNGFGSKTDSATKPASLANSKSTSTKSPASLKTDTSSLSDETEEENGLSDVSFSEPKSKNPKPKPAPQNNDTASQDDTASQEEPPSSPSRKESPSPSPSSGQAPQAPAASPSPAPSKEGLMRAVTEAPSATIPSDRLEESVLTTSAINVVITSSARAPFSTGVPGPGASSFQPGSSPSAADLAANPAAGANPAANPATGANPAANPAAANPAAPNPAAAANPAAANPAAANPAAPTGTGPNPATANPSAANPAAANPLPPQSPPPTGQTTQPQSPSSFAPPSRGSSSGSGGGSSSSSSEMQLDGDGNVINSAPCTKFTLFSFSYLNSLVLVMMLLL